jgi:hypothetical protein
VAKHTNVNIDLELQKALFEFADRARLAACGAPLAVPDGLVTVYRGVAGGEPDRRERTGQL